MRTTHIALTGIALIIAAGFYLLLIQLLRDTRIETFQATEETLVDTANLLAAFLEGSTNTAGQTDTAALDAALTSARSRIFAARIQSMVKDRVALHVYVTDAVGKVIYDSKGLDTGKDFSKWNDVKLTLAGGYGARSTRTDPGDPSTSFMHVAAPIRSGGKVSGVVTVVKAKSDQKAFVAAQRERIIQSCFMIAAGLLLFVGAVFFWLFHPMRLLSEYARSITSGKRPPLPGLGLGREARTLGRAIESMREELEGREYAGRYIRTLTHELKSPLSAIQGAAELLEEPMPEEQRRRFLTNIRNETERAGKLIRRLLRLSEVERQKTLEAPSAVDLAALMRRAAGDVEALAASRRICLSIHCPDETVFVTGTGELLHSALLNLLENAIDFSPPGGVVDFSYQAPAGPRTGPSVSITDQGPGIPDYAKPRLFERFYSLKHATTGRRGTGLGLCFVKEVALLHHAEITLTSPGPANGTRALLTFPA
ncbi:MAG: Two-component system sensor histidine kinase CreC [Verrucomicrobiales bacterium]|nr:Two-component system sensor histidine kinase CreC [Verrucomicrobiales bacterium]